MKKTIGIFAHVDSGKTTFSEQLLYHTNSIRSRGRVDHKDSFLDSHKIEKERGITVFSDIAKFDYKNSTYYLVDTPGHVDFSPEMERAMSILDYAILIVSAVEGVRGHTETIWNMLRKNNIPTFIFINKVDRTGADIDKILNEIRINLTKDLLYIDSDITNEINEEDKEFIAEKDDELLNLYLEDEVSKDLWIIKLKELIKNNKIFPCFKGSALLDIGILEFLDAFNLLTITDYKSKDKFIGRVFKVRYDDKGNRVTFIKALSGKLKTKDELNFNLNNEDISEKINGIRIYNGNKFNAI